MMTGFERYTKKTKRALFLEEMEQVVPWRGLCGLIEPHYPKAGNGRPPVGVERMLRIYFSEVCTLRTDGKTGEIAGSGGMISPPYLGQPLAGFFFSNDLLTAFFQSPLIFRVSGFGPGLARFLGFFFLSFGLIALSYSPPCVWHRGATLAEK